MKKIIEIGKLYDFKNNVIFGCVGLIENTSIIKYYSFYDNEGNYNENNLYEFDLNHPKPRVLEYHLANCPTSDKVPSDLWMKIKQATYLHYQYNMQNHFPINFLDFNSLYLEVAHMIEKNLGNRQSSAQYNTYENKLLLDLEMWEELTEKEKLNMSLTILHEIGHLKVTKRKLEQNQFIVQSGLIKDVILMDPILLSNGDVFYKVKGASKNSYRPEIIIEEIVNDFDCRQVSKLFSGHYPKFGERLNDLCDNKLQMARYTDGLSIFNECLLSIIKSQDLLAELIETLYTSVYSCDKWDREKNIEIANQLILKYEKVKQK